MQISRWNNRDYIIILCSLEFYRQVTLKIFEIIFSPNTGSLKYKKEGSLSEKCSISKYLAPLPTLVDSEHLFSITNNAVESTEAF